LSLLVVISVDSADTYLRQEALLSRDGTFFRLTRLRLRPTRRVMMMAHSDSPTLPKVASTR
jgi:hypothetical protein